MLESTWDWWFGDAPSLHRTTSRLFAEVTMKRFYETMRWIRGIQPGRRTFAWVLSGCLASTASVGVADDPLALTAADAQVASLPSGFFAAAGFAIINDYEIADPAEVGDG
ncbi:MAG: hypothetical protein ACF8AM_14745, partial [Rhodopirellula sp. JB055]